MKIPLAIWICTALALDVRIGREPISEDHEVPGVFCENCCIPDFGSPLLPNLFVRKWDTVHFA